MSIYFLSFIIFLYAFPIQSEKPNIWPWPKTVLYDQSAQQYLRIHSNDIYIVDISTQKCQIVTEAIKRYRDRMFVQDCTKLDAQHGRQLIEFTHEYTEPVGQIKRIFIENKGQCVRYPDLDMNEEYSLEVAANMTMVESQTPWGILRGLETLSQLVQSVGTGKYRIPLIKIRDSPRFPHRGLLIDSARHYLSMNSILKTMDGMEMNKMNVLHWHIVDDQSFPYVSEKFPQLSSKGSYSSATHVYKKSMIAEIIEYGRLRGIRVLPEFDTPGHASSWGKAIKGLLTECYDEKTHKLNGQYGPMNPTREFTFFFLMELFEEIADRFPDHYVHIGGDEVSFDCWISNPEVSRFFKVKNMIKDSDIEAYFVDKVIKMMKSLGKGSIVWQEVFTNGVQLPADAIVQIWQSWKENLWQTSMKRVIRSGHRAILSAPWYLDNIVARRDWNSFYSVDPFDFDGKESAKKELVLGGEACLWGEFTDSSNLIPRTWPRASAVAERLWSQKSVTDIIDARGRIMVQQCRMQRLGLRVSPIDGPDFCPCDYLL